MTYTKKETEEIKTNIILNIVQNVETINDANVGSGLDLFVTAVSQELAEQYDDMDVVYEGTRISTATEDDLEEIGLIVGIERNEGELATGTVSFIRNSSTSSDIIISAGTLVATQPNTGEEQLQFLTTEAKTLYTAIAVEENTFIDGIFEYKADSRFIDALTTLDNGTTTYTQNTDYSLSAGYDDIIIEPEDVSLINDCETAGDWTEGEEADTATANTSEYYEGTQSLNLIKSGTSSTLMSYAATFATTFDMSSDTLFTSLYIKDAAALAKISKVSLVVSDISDYSKNYTLDFSTLVVGWNRLYLDRTNADVVTTLNPNYPSMKYIKIIITTAATSSTFSAGDLMMDFWFTSTYENYEGDIIQWDKDQTVPVDSDTTYLTYVPLSVDIAVEANAVGVDYNISKGKITYKITSLANIDRVYNYEVFDGGIDVETDTDFRDRILSASDSVNVATTKAIKANVENLSFVSSCTVYDMPETAKTSEAHIYNSTTKEFELDNKVALDDANLVLSCSSGGSANYIKDTDYELVDNVIDFDIGGTAPTDGDTVYVDYHYDRLGYFTAFVTGVLGSLNTSELTEINTLLDEIKAAGINYTVSEPTEVLITVDANVTILTGYVSATMDTLISAAITSYIGDLEITEDVLLSGIIQTIMNVTGVDNTTVTDINGGGAADYVISTTQIARASTVTLTIT